MDLFKDIPNKEHLNIKDTPNKEHLNIKDTLNKEHLTIKDTCSEVVAGTLLIVSFTSHSII